MTQRTVIVGAGISGLSAAYYLRKAGRQVTVIERQPRVGGVIRTDVVQGCLVEGGPDSFLAAKPAALELIREIGLGAEVIGSNDHQRVTYVVRRGKLVPLPDGLMMMVPTRVFPMAMTPLLGWGTKIRMALEYFRRPGPGSGRDRSVADFIRDHYGQEAVDYLAEPLLAGVFGGDPEDLSVVSTLPRFVELENRYGSLTRGVLAGRSAAGGAGSLFRTLKGGMSQLVDTLRAHIPHIVEGEAEAVETGRVKVNGAWMDADHIVVATPAHEAARLIAGLDAEISALLDRVGYTSSMTVALGYRREDIRDAVPGFGFLVPRLERKRLVACTFVGAKFDYRVPPTHVLLRCFLTGSLGDVDEQIVRAVRAELRDLLRIDAAPAFARISRWPRSMAQYGVGHAARQKQVEAALARHPGLHLVGNAYDGIGIPDCIRLARVAAERIASRSAVAR